MVDVKKVIERHAFDPCICDAWDSDDSGIPSVKGLVSRMLEELGVRLDADEIRERVGMAYAVEHGREVSDFCVEVSDFYRILEGVLEAASAENVTTESPKS